MSDLAATGKERYVFLSPLKKALELSTTEIAFYGSFCDGK